MTTQIKETREVQITLSKSAWENMKSLSQEAPLEEMIQFLILKGLNAQDWSNSAALGYMLLAADEITLDPEITYNLLRAMFRQFDIKTLKEAEEAYWLWKKR